MRETATKKKPVFVQANSNSGQGHVLHYITSFCVVFRLSTLYFWLAGKTETKQVVNRMSKWVEGGGRWKGHEYGLAVFIFLAATPLLRPARQNRHATQARRVVGVTFSLWLLMKWVNSVVVCTFPILGDTSVGTLWEMDLDGLQKDLEAKLQNLGMNEREETSKTPCAKKILWPSSDIETFFWSSLLVIVQNPSN